MRKVELIRKKLDGSFVNYHDSPQLAFGFTEKNFKMEQLLTLFPGYRIVELEQTHSAIIKSTSQILPGCSGDGIIIDEPGVIVVIETADCTPLFFWDDDYSIGGVVHIGWRGLAGGIEKELIGLLKENDRGTNKDNDDVNSNRNNTILEGMNFFTGPAIEGQCYEVGTELPAQFAERSFADAIFTPKQNTPGKLLLDVEKGIRLSLLESGVPEGRISSAGICTYCHTERFPSYRREKGTGERINNFLLFKNQH